jgi:hypothetical protein
MSWLCVLRLVMLSGAVWRLDLPARGDVRLTSTQHNHGPDRCCSHRVRRVFWRQRWAAGWCGCRWSRDRWRRMRRGSSRGWGLGRTRRRRRRTGCITQWWDPSSICLRSDVDTSVYLVSSWNPFAVWSYPFSPQFFGEAAYLASDVAGNAASQTQFTSLGGEREDNDNWEGYPCLLLSASNDGSSKRADGESWHLVANGDVPKLPELY